MINTKFLLILILLLSFSLRLIHINGGFSQDDEFSDVYGALNITSISPVKWLDPNSYMTILWHGPLNSLAIASISNFFYYFYYLLYDVPFPLNNNILSYEHINQIYLIETFFRIPNIIFSLLTIYLTYKIGREYSEKTGLIAALLLGTMSWYLIINYLVAPYTFVTLLITASVYLFYKKRYTIASILGALSVYTTALALVIPFIAILYLILKKQSILSTLPKKSIKLYFFILIIPALIILYQGGLRWAYGELLGTVLSATVKYETTWFQLWDPTHGVFTSNEYPFLYLEIIFDYLSIPFILFALIGIAMTIYNNKDIDKLLLAWLFVAFIVLNIISAKTIRYPSILLPALSLFVAIAIVKISDSKKIWMTAFLILIIIPQPNLSSWINDKYVTVTEDAALIYDFRSVTDSINKNTSPSDNILFDGRRTIPYWLLKGNLSNEKPNYIISEQYAFEAYASGKVTIILSDNTTYYFCGKNNPPDVKIASQINSYKTHRIPYPQDKIYHIDGNIYNATWTCSFYDYPDNYKEIAFGTPLSLEIYRNYILEKVIRTKEKEHAIIYLYRKN